VLTPDGASQAMLPADSTNQRLALKFMPEPVLASLRWPGRPELAAGNLAWTYMVDAPTGRFALFVGQVEEAGRQFPFEVWVNGAEQPRGLGAVAKTLSMDMRANDRAWLARKLDALAGIVGDDAFEMRFPPHGEPRKAPSVVSAMAQAVRWRCEQLRTFDGKGPSPLLDHMFSVEEPRTGTDGTLAWTVDITHPTAGDEFVLGLKDADICARLACEKAEGERLRRRLVWKLPLIVSLVSFAIWWQWRINSEVIVPTPHAGIAAKTAADVRLQIEPVRRAVWSRKAVA